MPDRTQTERLKRVADSNENLAKFLDLAIGDAGLGKEGPIYAQFSAELGGVEKKQEVFHNLLWQTARMVSAVVRTARAWEIDVEWARERLREAVEEGDS
jgi:hypothetical protein